MTTTHVLRPIPATEADRLRDQGGDVYVADTMPGFPCRQCLRDAEVGEELILVSYDPFGADSPYRSASPIFLHRSPCSTQIDDGDDLPEQLTRRQLSVRAFDRKAMMLDAAVIDGSDLEATIAQMLGEPSTDHLHIHNASRGCWAVAVERVK